MIKLGKVSEETKGTAPPDIEDPEVPTFQSS